MELLIMLLFSALTLPTVVTKTTANTSVQDVDGRELRRGPQYYILPAHHGNGGGLMLAGRSKACPLAVAQEKLEQVHGLPITFSTSDAHDEMVQLSKDVNIDFQAATLCAQSTVWKVGDVDRRTGRRYVVAGGSAGSPGIGTVSSWFKIERNGSDYKIVYCPTVCEFCEVVCGDVGVFVEDGKRWVGLSEVPFPVMFRRVEVV